MKVLVHNTQVRNSQTRNQVNIQVYKEKQWERNYLQLAKKKVSVNKEFQFKL